MADTSAPPSQPASGGNTLASKIFRKSALERLSTPEQLDQLVTLNGSWAWLATATVWLLLAGLMAWGVTGSITSYVEGDGMIVARNGQVLDVTSDAEGRVLALDVAVGDSLAEGQAIGRLDQSQLRLDLTHAQAQAADLAGFVAELQKARDITKGSAIDVTNSLEALLRASRARRDHLETTVTDLESRLARGVDVPLTVLSNTRSAFLQADQDVHAVAADLARLRRGQADTAAQQALDLAEAEQAHRQATRRVADLEQRLARSETLTTRVGGTVTEIKVAPGALVSLGQPLLSLVRGGNGLEALVFLPPETGKDVQVGQRVGLQPAHIKKEEFGAIHGTVTAVSDFPVSPERIRAVLPNDALVAAFSGQGARYLATVALLTDVRTPSGLSWTSGEGPPRPISPGSIALAEVEVRDQRPMEFVIPLFRKYTGLGY